MAIPNTNWSEITTTTLYNRSQKLADNVTKNNALLRRLSQKSKIKPFDGGQAIVQEIEYSENGTFKRYSGYDVLSISPPTCLPPPNTRSLRRQSQSPSPAWKCCRMPARRK